MVLRPRRANKSQVMRYVLDSNGHCQDAHLDSGSAARPQLGVPSCWLALTAGTAGEQKKQTGAVRGVAVWSGQAVARLTKSF